LNISRFNNPFYRFLGICTGIVMMFLRSTCVSAQLVTVTHGADFMGLGAGARYLGMGGTGVSFADDVMAGYWNPAGLASLERPQIAYMHSERFAGLVSYDFGSAAIPVDEAGAVIGVTFFRQAVDDIKNTTNAWDRDRGVPYPDAADRFELFSASDMAFLISYAGAGPVQWGVNAKFLYSKIGPFANAWGYSLDAGIQGNTGHTRWGVMLSDATTLSKFWTVNAGAFQDREANFDDVIPEGHNERTLPSLRAGLSHRFTLGRFSAAVAVESDMRFENRQTFYLNTGPVSYEPHLGLEIEAFKMLYLRGGLTNFYRENDEKLSPMPTIGAGLEFKHLSLDYGFDNFSGVSSVLGNTHRISLIYRFAEPKGK
jgi:hypothetical protein